MSLPEIRFESIRPQDGSQQTGFEELCCQLASLETDLTDSEFYRKGRGGDAGVECIRILADRSEIGWQAKYIFSWSTGLESQLDGSIEAALKGHPALVDYIVCLPFDLSDARKGNAKSTRSKWESWRSKWQNSPRGKKRRLKIQLWGRSELISRLTAPLAACAGRVLYWFGVESLTPKWFSGQFEKARAALGTRYTPETNIELPIRRDFLAFTRDDSLQRQVEAWHTDLVDKGRSVATALHRVEEIAAAPYSNNINAAVGLLRGVLSVAPVSPDRKYNLDGWSSAADECEKRAHEANSWLYSLAEPPKHSKESEALSWARNSVWQFLDVIRDIKEVTDSRRWALANANAALLEGPAGIGKSHLLGDIVDSQIYAGRPAILMLGSSFSSDDPLRQILTTLDRPSTEQGKHFLGALDACAEAAGCRALLCIDAINERNGMEIWPNHLAAFLKTLEAFPRIGVLLSCRSTYVPYIVPDGLVPQALVSVEHAGFAEDGGKAAAVYLDKRGIVRPGAPSLAPEFNNPLFLKTCCDFLDKEGSTELPRGLRGVTSIFGFFSLAVERAVTRRMKLDPNQKIISKAISAFATALANGGNGYLPIGEANAIFDSVLPSQGKLESSLRSQLESEGLLHVEPIREKDGVISEFVRFNFERFGDHAIAKNFLDACAPGATPAKIRKHLSSVLFGKDRYIAAGLIEAVAIQLPERFNIEIIDIDDGWRAREAFMGSLLWREQSTFSARTFELLQSTCDQSTIYDVLVSISTEPTNKYNAEYLHSFLSALSMPQRDATWSVYLAENDLEGSVETLITWAIRNGTERIDDDRASLSVTALSWLLTASHREIRDKATKGLTCILSGRLEIAAQLVRDFSSVNDPYVIERVVCSCYGAALQGARLEGLAQLAKAVYDAFFASGAPPTDALLRDHAACLIEYAAHCGQLPSGVDMALVRPPYRSPWPIEAVPDELIAGYKRDGTHSSFHDEIVSSTIKDGDFARYVVEYKMSRWSPAPIGTKTLPTSEVVATTWVDSFLAKTTASKRAAFDDYLIAAKAASRFPVHEKNADTDALAEADRKLLRVLGVDDYEEFRVKARSFIRHELFDERRSSGTASFDNRWAGRWICKRAHDLGWTPDLFGSDIRSRTYDRHNHRIERIGKKYQWIALRELLGRMADNLAFIVDRCGQNENGAIYKSARDISLRDIDPSLLITSTHYDGWREWPPTWWIPCKVNLRSMAPQARLEWLDRDDDVLNDAALIELRDPKTGRRWLALDTFVKFSITGVLDGRKELQRDACYRLKSFVVKRRDLKRAIGKFKNQSVTDAYCLPTLELGSEFYLGEYAWHPDIQSLGDWHTDGDSGARALPTRPTVASYSCSTGGYDYSIDDTISVETPAPWLARAMGLRLMSGKSPIYADARSGELLFYDPSVVEPGPAAALVDRHRFLQALEHDNLCALWVVSGEKNAHGGPDIASGFGGRVTHTSIYYFDNDVLIRTPIHKVIHRPSLEQLEEFFVDKALAKRAFAAQRSEEAMNSLRSAAKKKKSPARR